MISKEMQDKVINIQSLNSFESKCLDKKSLQLRSDPVNHHQHMLKNMSSLIEEENLTDMTIQCSDGMYVHTHQKLLSSVSSLTRKLSREQNVIVENQRLHLIINDISRQTVLHLLKILYTGYSEALNISDIDEIHKLCQLLGIIFKDNSIFTFLTVEGSTEDIIKDNVHTKTKSILEDKTLTLGSGDRNPSETITKFIQNHISTDIVEYEKTMKKGNLQFDDKEQKNDQNSKISKRKHIKDKHVKQKVYCICREEERPGMIGCDHCDEWYHTQCLSLSKEEIKRLSSENWSCPNCEFKKVRTKFNSTSAISKSQKTLEVVLPKSSEKPKNENRTLSNNIENINSNSEKPLSDPSLKILSHNYQSGALKNKKKRCATVDQGINETSNKIRKEEKNLQSSNCEDTKSTAFQNKFDKSCTQNDDNAEVHCEEQSSNKCEANLKGKSDAPTKIKEVKSSKSNEQTPSSTSQYTLTNKRMSVPQQKKPKKSFEEALFEGMSPRHTMKRQPEKERKSNVNMLKSDKEQKKYRKDNHSDDAPERKSINSTDGSEREQNQYSPNSISLIQNDKRNSSIKGIAEDSSSEIRYNVFNDSRKSIPTEKKIKSEETTNQLFFCYSCKSIFISSEALESHKQKLNHFG